MLIFPTKGAFSPEEKIELRILPFKLNSVYTIELFDLGQCIYRSSYQGSGRLLLPAQKKDFAGYYVQCQSDDGETASCCVNIQSECRVFRYGFLSDYILDDNTENIMHLMASHHINAVQFYDWSYRHDNLVSPSEYYKDMMGKENRLSVVKNKIRACHVHGMKAIAYGAVYAACREFAEQHKDWRLYAGKDLPLKFIEVFSIMNPESPWKNHIVSEYRSALDLGFDGIHMDTYGFPKIAFDISQTPVYLENSLPDLIRHTRNALPDATLVFNNVGGWPLDKTVNSPVDAVYVEVWPPYSRYAHLKQIITQMARGQKPMVVAAYPAAFRTDTPDRALNSQLMLMSVIAFHGATQIWYGEDGRAITQGYYADNSKLSSQQETSLRGYDDFFVQYQELLFDPTLQDVSFSHCGWDNQEYRCSVPFSVDGESEKLWLILRENRAGKLISLLNLTGDPQDDWASGRNAPLPIQKISFSVQIEKPVHSVFYASPDEESPLPIYCDYTLEQTGRSPVLHFTIPGVNRCGIIWIQFSQQE